MCAQDRTIGLRLARCAGAIAYVYYLRDKAAKNSEQQLFPRTEELLVLERENFSAAFAGWQKEAIPQLENVKACLMAWPLDGLNWKQICNAV